MLVPPGHTPESVTAALLEAARAVAHLYTFGYHEVEDAQQEAIADAIESALPKYRAERGELVAFLARHMRFRLSNYKRNHYWRNEPPCRGCADGRLDVHGDGRPCAKHLAWIRLNTAKANLVHPLDIENLENEPSLRDVAHEEAERDEAEGLIDALLPAELRADYLRLRAGVRLPKGRRNKVLAAVREALA